MVEFLHGEERQSAINTLDTHRQRGRRGQKDGGGGGQASLLSSIINLLNTSTITSTPYDYRHELQFG
jgi:hypothetical protein